MPVTELNFGELRAEALKSAKEKNWSGALRIWTEVRRRFEDQPIGYVGSATVLRVLRKFDEAENLLAEAAERFANNAPIALQRAWLANDRSDWPEAVRRWQTARPHFNDDASAYVGAGIALRNAGQLDEAENLLAEAAERFANNAMIALQRAWLANDRSDWPEAVRRWQTARPHFNDDASAYVGAGIALRNAGQLDEAENLLAEAAERFANNAPIALQRAWLANDRSDWPEAVRRWQAARPHFDDNASAYVGAGIALRNAGQLDEAENLLAEAAARLANNAPIALQRAWLANDRCDWPEAVRRWQAITTRWPNEIQGYLGAITTLNEVGRTNEAAALLTSARAALTKAKHAGIESIYSRRLEFAIARMDKDWSKIRRVAEGLISGEANPPTSILCELANACWQLKDLAAAEKAATRALAIDPNADSPAFILASTIAEGGDAEETLSQYRQQAGLAPENPRWAIETARLLHLTGRVEEAESELEKLQRHWPDDPNFVIWQLDHGHGQSRSNTFGDKRLDNKAVALVARELQEIVKASPTDDQLQRPLVVDDAKQDVIIAAANGAETAVMVFTGTFDHLTIPISLFDRHLAAFGVTGIYVKDFQRLMYLKGIRSLGNYDDTLAALRRLLDGVGATRICSLGVKAGGYAAIRYGIELGAERIVSFEGLSGRLRLAAAAQVGVRPFQNLLTARVRNAIPEQQRDLRTFLDARPHRAAIELVYGEQMAVAEAHAKYLATLPGVRLWPQAGVGDRVLRNIARRFDFHDTLRHLLQLPDRPIGKAPR